KHLLNKSFGDFIDALSIKYLFGNLYMFNENLDIDEALQNLKKVDRVYFQDNLIQAFEDLRNTLDLKKMELSKPQRKFNNKNFEITSLDKEKAIAILEQEIKFYNRAREIYTL